MDKNIYIVNGKNVNGIFTFIEEDEIVGENQKFLKLYNKISPFYNISQRLFYKLKFGGEKHFRNEFLKYIKINDNDLVLETSVGTADNFRFLNKKAKYFGADISTGMLKMALKHIKKWKINAEFNVT